MKDTSSITILIVDDEEAVRNSFADYLEDEGYNVQTAVNGEEGLSLITPDSPHVVLTDLYMPKMNGLELLEKGIKVSPDIPYIVISGIGKISDIVSAMRSGAWDYIEKPLRNLEFLKHQIEKNFEKYSLQVENKQYKNHLEELVAKRTEELEHKNRELELSRRQIIGILSQAAEYRDFETGRHFMRVSSIASIVARGIGWTQDQIDIIELAAPVHDIGKIGIPDSILLKNDKLSEEDWEEMRKHCDYGKEILLSGKNRFPWTYLNSKNQPNESNNPIIDTAAEICQFHHEHWDGSGYPNGIKGSEIPLSARITAIADYYDALLSKRPYKKAWKEEDVLKIIKENSGKRFDPELVDVFFKNIDLIREIRKLYADNEEV